MKVAIIGARGQLGTELVKTKPKGVDLFALAKEDLDITDRERAVAVLRETYPDAVINAAAYVRVDDAEDEAGQAFKINAWGVKNLAEACHEIKAPLLYVSTDYVFDGNKAPEPYHEDDMPHPINVYGASKYVGEHFLKSCLERYYIIRTASLYGFEGAGRKGKNFVFTILDKASKGETIKVVDDVTMSPTLSRDLAAGIWGLIRKEDACGIYHMTNSGWCSWFEFAREIVRSAKIKSDVVPISHTEFARKATIPLWSPLVSVKGIKLRVWESALKAFIKEIVQ